MLKPYQDPMHHGNSPLHLTGKLCIEKGCDRPAGTAWSPYWCHPCNVVRLDRIEAQLKAAIAHLDEQPLPPPEQSKEGV